MKPISYRAVAEFRKHRKLKSGLAPTGVLRQNLVLHNSFQGPIYAAPSQKTNASDPFSLLIHRLPRTDSRSPMRTKNLAERAAPRSFPASQESTPLAAIAASLNNDYVYCMTR